MKETTRTTDVSHRRAVTYCGDDDDIYPIILFVATHSDSYSEVGFLLLSKFIPILAMENKLTDEISTRNFKFMEYLLRQN